MFRLRSNQNGQWWNRAGGPASIPLGPDTFLENGVSKVAEGEKTFAQAASGSM